LSEQRAHNSGALIFEKSESPQMKLTDTAIRKAKPSIAPDPGTPGMA